MHNKTLVLALSAMTIAVVGCSDGSLGGGADGDVSTGTGGSTARMTISGDFLYAIAGSRVQLFDITTPEAPAPWVQVQIDWDIQTLFPYGDFLLVGAADGVHILDNTDPGSPIHVGDFQHARAIDPVVAQDGFAYVTLRTDNTQPGPSVANQLNVIDIQDITQPELLTTLPMQGPAGLSIEDENLYVCDGEAGLKTFDLVDPVNPTVTHAVPGLNCSDVIAQGNQLFVIDDLGLSQYSTESGTPVLLSTIDTQPVVYIVD